MTPNEHALPGKVRLGQGPPGLLLVDDHPDNLLGLEGLLAPLDLPLCKATSGSEALRMVQDQDFAAILLDVRMPIMDGYETASLIRRQARSQHTPILFLTAQPASEVQVFHGYASGAVDFLTKPFRPEILRSKVRVFVELAKRAQVLEALNLRLEDLNAGLKAANQELDAFSDAVSHDLRAPLRQMEGFLALLAPPLEQTGNEEALAFLGNARDAAQRMSLLIEGMLGFGRLASGDLLRTPVDLNALLAGVLQEVARGLADRRIHWQIDPLPTVLGDPALLGAAFHNLLGNAVKFTQHRSLAIIEVGSLPSPPDEHWVFVRDNGAGFAPEQARHLFGAFQRLHSQDAFEGTGLGLANVHRIIHRHRGRIWAEGRLDEGATFFLAFPREPVP